MICEWRKSFGKRRLSILALFPAIWSPWDFVWILRDHCNHPITLRHFKQRVRTTVCFLVSYNPANPSTLINPLPSTLSYVHMYALYFFSQLGVARNLYMYIYYGRTRYLNMLETVSVPVDRRLVISLLGVGPRGPTPAMSVLDILVGALSSLINTLNLLIWKIHVKNYNL